MNSLRVDLLLTTTNSMCILASCHQLRLYLLHQLGKTLSFNLELRWGTPSVNCMIISVLTSPLKVDTRSTILKMTPQKSERGGKWSWKCSWAESHLLEPLGSEAILKLQAIKAFKMTLSLIKYCRPSMNKNENSVKTLMMTKNLRSCSLRSRKEKIRNRSL